MVKGTRVFSCLELAQAKQGPALTGVRPQRHELAECVPRRGVLLLFVLQRAQVPESLVPFRPLREGLIVKPNRIIISIFIARSVRSSRELPKIEMAASIALLGDPCSQGRANNRH